MSHEPVGYVDFVADQYGELPLSYVLLVHGHPALDVGEGAAGGHVVDDDGAVCVLQVSWDEASVALLACGVPELQLIGFVAVLNVFVDEVDPDGRLHKLRHTLPD